MARVQLNAPVDGGQEPVEIHGVLSEIELIGPTTAEDFRYNRRTPTVPPVGEAPVDEVTGYGTQRCYGDHIKDAGEGA